MMSPMIFTVTTTTNDEEVLRNPAITSILNHLTEEGSELCGKISMFFNGANFVQFNNDGIYQGLLFDMIWESGDNILSVSSLKVKNPCTFTLQIDFK